MNLIFLKVKSLFKTILVFIVFLLLSIQVNAATTTITYTQTASDIAGGSFSWTNPSNATGDTTNTSASSSISTRNAFSNYLSLTNFDLAGAGLPIGSTINGIQVDVEWQVSNTRMRDTTVQLTKDGTSLIGLNYASNANAANTAKNTTTYGGLTDLWGTTWTYQELLNSNFGVILQYQYKRNRTASVDIFRVSVTVDYTPNNSPSDITLSNQSIDSSLPIGSLVGTITTTDADVGDTHTYSFTCSSPGVDDASFSISNDELQSAEIFDYTVKSTYDICIRTDDGRGGTFDKNFNITINPPTPNNPPTDITLSNNTIYENLAIGSLVGNLTTTDPDTSDNHSYSFSCSTPGVDDTSFSILSDELQSTEIFNQATKSTYDICIRTDDGRGGTFDKNFTINILVNPNLGYAYTATDIGGGNFSWTNPTNAELNTTNTFATSTMNVRNSDGNFLALTDFHLDQIIPDNVIINGIQADVERNVTNTRVRDQTIQLTKDGTTPIGNNNALQADGPTAKTITSYGSPTDLWGTTWTKTDLIDPNFGILLQYRYKRNGTADVNIYRVKITIDYSLDSGPGGIGSISVWLKADAGTSTTTSGNALNSWADQSGNGYDASAGVSPIYLYDDTNNLNYNPYVDFDGTQYLENLNNGAYSHSYFVVIVPDNKVDGTLSGQVPFALDCNSGVLSSGTCGLTFAGLTLGSFTVAINDEVITHAIGSSTNWRSAQIGTASYDANYPMLINMNENAAGTGTEISEKGLILDNYNANTYQTLSTADYRIGMSSDGANPFPYDGKIAEIINYDGRIEENERIRIESYLAIKYGITLANGSIDYIASDDTTKFWNNTNAGTYTNNIFGIARDDLSELSQVKSKSINSSSVITLEAVGEGTNTTPSFTDMSDLEFLSISNNGLGNTWQQTGAPSGYYNLERQWRVQEVGEVGTVNLDFNVANTNFDIPPLSLGTSYYFVYDSNNNDDLSDETPIAMTNTTGDIWQIAGINLDNLREFTIATQASSNNIPTDISLSNNSINENVSPGTNIGTFSTVDADIGDTHTYSFVAGTGDDDNIYMNISGNTLSIIHSPDYEIKQSYNIRVQTDDGNGGQFQKTFTININDVGEAIPTSLDFEDPLDDYKYTNTSGIWSRSTNNPYEGLYSLESDNLGANNSQACFEMTNTLTQTGTINFYYYVSSEAGSDFLRFYINNIEQQSWSGDVAWTQYSKTDVSSGTNTYKWCYIKDGAGSAGTDNAYIDFVATQPTISETIPPNIISINYASGSLLPGGNHNIIINYEDLDSGIDVNSDTIALYKWDGVSSWGPDISSTGFNLGSKSVTSTTAIYPTNNLSFGKYLFDFSISDIASNSSSTGSIFYIDEPELNISTGTIDIGKIKSGSDYFSSNEITITIKTVGAGFDIILNKIGNVVYDVFEILDYNGTTGIGYDIETYTSTIMKINPDEILATQAGSININGNKNTYIYKIRLGAAIEPEQAAGDYTGSLQFKLDLNY